MRILIINAILYTNEDKIVRKVESVRDCMICDLCDAFVEKGHHVTLIAAEEYRPIIDEKYRFDVVWMKSYLKSIFMANKIPFNLKIRNYLKNNEFDLVISSEIFSIDTLLAAITCPEKLIIWQEMAFHQKMAKKLASKIWHNVILKLCYKDVRVIPRTYNARKFISNYTSNISENTIQHGVNLDKFECKLVKERIFIVSSQLIARKRVDLVLKAFNEFCDKVSDEFVLYIAGDGNQKEELMALATELNMMDNVVFLGKVEHTELIGYLKNAMAMLVYTEKDNSMISITESIAVATPVITTAIPDNSKYIKEHNLGIVSDNWGWQEMKQIVMNNDLYVNNCKAYRYIIDNKHNVDLFIQELESLRG
jgi:1,2-diacylglycerol 3-alpha-glucosyltransferase